MMPAWPGQGLPPNPMLAPGDQLPSKKSFWEFRDACHIKWTMNQPPLLSCHSQQETTMGKSKELDLIS